MTEFDKTYGHLIAILESYSGSADDALYMELARDPEKNKAELQRMVDRKAVSSGFKGPFEHGTRENFNVFSNDRIGSRYGKDRKGFFFTHIGGVASDTSALNPETLQMDEKSKLIHVYLQMENPFTDSHLQKMIGRKIRYYADGNDDSVYMDASDAFDNNRHGIMEYVERNGMDSIFLRGGDLAVVFSPGQIKLADPMTYDDKGNIIPISKRFSKNVDIRESSELPDRLRNDIDDLAISKTIEPALQELFRKYIRADRKAEAANDYNTPSGNAGKRSASTRKFRELSKEYSRLHPEDTARQGLIDQHTKFMKIASDEYRDAVEGVEMSIAKTDLNESENDDYRGNHQAPMSDSGSPLHDLSGTYPDDIYSNMGARYYGHYGDSRDMRAINIIQAYRNHPSRPITIYRAVPYESSHAEKISRIEADMKDVLKYGTRKYHKDTYDILYKDLAKLKAETPVGSASKAPDTINVGDWVTIDRKYAREHGEGVLNGKYRIVSKTVRARDIFTNGDSIFEFGYDPQ